MRTAGWAPGWIAVTMAVIAACGGNAPEQPDAAPTTTAVAVTTTPAAATTIQDLDAAEQITPNGLLKWQPGSTYTTDAFWTPVSFTASEAGWWSQGVAEVWLTLEYHQGGASTFDLDLTLLAHDPDRSTEDAIDAILADESATTIVGPTSTAVAGRRAITADLVVEESSLFGGTCEVNPSPGNSRFATNDSGIYLLTEVGGVAGGAYGNSFGIRSCRAARVWAIDVDGSTILAIAATTRADQFDDLIPRAVALIEGMSFGEG